MTMPGDAGAEAGGFSLEVFAGLKASLDDNTRELRAMRARAIDLAPIFYRRANNAIIPSPTAATAIGLGGPAPGRAWHVRGVRVGGLTWGSAAAGTAELYVSAFPGKMIASARDFQYVVDEATSLPAPAFYGEGEVVVHNPETVHLVIVGGTAGQQYVANLQATDFSIAQVSDRDLYSL